MLPTDIHLAGLVRRSVNAGKSDQCLLRMKAADISDLCYDLSLRYSAYITLGILVYVLGLMLIKRFLSNGIKMPTAALPL